MPFVPEKAEIEARARIRKKIDKKAADESMSTEGLTWIDDAQQDSFGLVVGTGPFFATLTERNAVGVDFSNAAHTMAVEEVLDKAGYKRLFIPKVPTEPIQILLHYEAFEKFRKQVQGTA